MESTLVSARMPQAKKDSATEILRSMGSSTSELINSAFDYLIDTRELPRASSASSGALRDAEGFRRFVSASTFDVDWGADCDMSYKDIMARERLGDYESLA